MKSDLWSRIKLSFRIRKDLDQLLNSAPGNQANLRELASWFFDLLEWVRREGVIKHEADFKTGAPQAARIRYLLNILDRNLEWKKSVAVALRGLIRQTTALNLFLETGISLQDSFGAEFIERLQKKFLPTVPMDNDLAYLFQNNFHSETDLQWIRQLDGTTFKRIEELFSYGIEPSEPKWNTMKDDAERALLLLSIQVQGLGMSSQIRQRIEERDFEKISFYQLTKLIEKYVAEKDFELKAVLGAQIEKKLQNCFLTIAEVQQHLDEYGVSIQIVFQIDKLESLLKRIQNLNALLQPKSLDPVIVSSFMENLIFETLEKKRLGSLLSQSFSLMARKIVERTAETGEHYITRNVAEYFDMFQMALGGGLLTAMTTILKFSISALGLSSFYSGFFASINYSLSFLAIHFSHFTLATKQSSMTAPALAAKMHEIQNPESLEKLVDEILNTIRSQVIAVVGNIMGVIPLTILIALLYQQVFGNALLTQEKAIQTLHEFSILGPTPLYAIFTGFLLWGSSLFAGWMDNWFAYHRLGVAIAQNRRIVFVLGESRARFFSSFFKRNFAGIMGSVSLGFLLGLSPAILQFFGIHLDVRHVTLSSGSLAVALVSLPIQLYTHWDLALAILGVASMGVLNLLVSFVLALIVAIRARKVHAPERQLIYKAVFARLKSEPFSLFWPKKTS